MQLLDIDEFNEHDEFNELDGVRQTYRGLTGYLQISVDMQIVRTQKLIGHQEFNKFHRVTGV